MTNNESNDRLISGEEETEALELALNIWENAEEYQRMVDRLSERVVEFAREDPEVAERLENRRHEILGADFHPVDMLTEEGVRPLREGEVSIYDYEKDTLLSVVVDLREGVVDRIAKHPGVQPPPTTEEQEEAIEISQEFLDQLQPEVVPLQVPIPEDHPSHGHRVVEVWYTAGGDDDSSVIVLVDLSRREVVKDVDHPWR